MSGFLRVLANMASEIEALRAEGVEQHLILDDVVKDLRALSSAGRSTLAGEFLRRQQLKSAGENHPGTPDQVTCKPWSQIPAGWWIQDPTGRWWEVLATESDGRFQRVAMRSDGQRGEWPRKPGEMVTCVPGTAAPEIQGAVDALGTAFHVDVLKDQVES